MLDQILPSLSSVATVTALGAAFGLILSVAKIKLHVEKDPRIEKINEVLPGANCGACGLPGCAGYASKIVEKGLDINLCPVGGSDTASAIADIMGVSAEESVSKKARVHCHGGLSETVNRFIYNGPRDCEAAHDLMGGFKGCQYGCLGLGNCVVVCPFDAIHMGEDGLPIVDFDACTGCGKCVTACPRDIISLVPENFSVYVLCKNEEKGGVMKKSCKVGCIGCKKCEKVCKEVMQRKNPDLPEDEVTPAITVKNFCAVIDYGRCTNCYRCVLECPVPVIHPIEKSKKYKAQQKKARELAEGKAEGKAEEHVARS